MSQKTASTEWPTLLVASMLCLMALLLLSSCATPTAIVAPPDPRLTVPCEKPPLPERITPRRLGTLLVEQWQSVDECNTRINLLRE